MKIERTNRPATVPVVDVMLGGVFELEGRAYMVLPRSAFTGDIGEKVIYSVNLETGTLLNLSREEPVIPRPDAKVVL